MNTDMNFFQEEYERACRTPTDINEHLPVLRKLAESVDAVTELGVRDGVSTRAFLAANVRLRSYDIVLEESVGELFARAKSAGIDAEYIQGDSLAIDLQPTQVLFIDTFHVRRQLAVELVRHAPAVRGYIVLHDTVNFGLADEKIGDAKTMVKTVVDSIKQEFGRGQFFRRLFVDILPKYWHKFVRRMRGGGVVQSDLLSAAADDAASVGLLNAVLPFLAEHANEWRVYAHYPNNNGLTILARNNPENAPHV